MSSKEFSEPIPCPKCGKKLTTVQVEKITVLEYNEKEECEEEESGFEDNGQGSTKIICGSCGKVIGESNANGSWGIYPFYSEDY